MNGKFMKEQKYHLIANAEEAPSNNSSPNCGLLLLYKNYVLESWFHKTLS